jgi:hypothetical protein
MPYFLRKKPLHELYWVVNKETGKKYSYEPLDKETAVKQMKALYTKEGLEPPVIKFKYKYPQKASYKKGSEEARKALEKARSFIKSKK